MLTVRDLDVHYGSVHALAGVDLEVARGSVTALLGANGAGKTTTLMAVAGARRISAGTVDFEGRSLVGQRAEAIIRSGIAVVPEGRRVFASLTVEENLRVAGSLEPDAAKAARRRAAMMERFPILAERRAQRAGLLSGGEQQMLAIARALMSAPRLLLLDEPSLGLAPQMVDRVFDLIAELKAEGLAMLLVEQNVPLSLEIADRVVVLANGRVSVAGTAAELAGSDLIRGAYLAA
ncbi:ABC transporter ATP-binding protein [Acuticoccus sp. I52.16.1]|uniref:ABC transporter ATP-binding protein n=1 Tax=Acuticoccus sp. I52.16.1 TaxID=2928472 RepID=UPI001FD005E0|nr:ABC transporter ATP-binding protein [Acuticoccus sp. I52.16.1]UOM36875.1 ABC transporter ATP-binding protein [Acuticoccus sp. I52.16.1]